MPPVFTPNPANERVPGSTPLLATPYSSSIQAQPPSSTGGALTSDQWAQLQQQIMQKIQEAGAGLTASSGYSKWALEQQYADAEKGRQNAIQLEQMREKAARYGVDAQTASDIRNLTEKANEFQQNHILDIQKLGLDRAKTETDYLATPDKFFEGQRYLNLSGRILAGQPGVAPDSSIGTPTPNTEAGFAALQAGGQSAAPGSTTDTSPAGVAAAAAGTGAGADGRAKALKTLIDAVPPSTTPGLDSNGAAVLRAAHAIYSTNLNPQEFNALKSDPTNLAINRDAGRNLGIDVPSWEAQQRRNGLGQASALAA